MSFKDWQQENVAIAKPQPTGFEAWKQENKATFLSQLGGAFVKGAMRLGGALVDLPKHIVNQVKILPMATMADEVLAAKDPKIRAAKLKDMAKVETFFGKMTDELGKAGELHRAGTQTILKNHPEWESQPPKSFVDLLTSPDKLMVSWAESTPLLLGAGILTVAGAPQMGIMMMYASEGQEAYNRAITYGTSEKNAEDAYLIYGTVAAALENMQLQHIMKISKGLYNQVLNRTAQKVARKGMKALTMDVIKVSAKEALEEVTQGEWGDITAKIVYGEPFGDLGEHIDRRAQEAYIGFMMGVLPSGASAGVAKAQQRMISKAPTELSEPPAAPPVAEVPAEGVEVPPKPLEPTTPDEAIGKLYGLNPIETQQRLDNAEKKYRDLKTKPVEDRTKIEKTELAFLRRNRKNIEALLERETKPPEIKPATRRKLLVIGHKYPQQLEMTEKERRDFMESITGMRSMKNMSRIQMKQVTDAFREEVIAQGIEPDIMQPEEYGEPIVINNRVTTMEETIGEGANVLDDLPTKVDVPKHIHRRFFKKIRRTGLAHRLGRLFWGIDNSPLYELTAILEQGKPGIFTEVFDDNIQQGRAIAAGHKRSVSIAFRDFAADNGISDQDLAKISEASNARMFHGLLETLHKGTTVHTIEINNHEYNMTPAELLDVYLIAQQEDGLRHIYGGGFVIDGVKTGKISEEALGKLLQLSEENDKIMQLADIISQIENNIWKPSINNVSMALDKKEIATVENWWGLEVLMPKQLAGKIRKFNVNLIENKSILKDRTKAKNPLVIRDALQRFTGFENAIAEYVGMASATRTARTVLNDQNLNETLRSKGYGPLRDNMHLILERAQSVAPTSGSFDRLLGQVIPGIYRGVLFFNPRVVMSQYTSVTNYQAFVSAKYATLVTKGLTPEAIQRTLEISDIAWDRFYMGHSSLELGELAASDATLRLLTQTSADKNKLGITLRLADIGALAAGTEIAIAEYKDAQSGKITGESSIYWGGKDTSFKEESPEWERAVVERAEWLWHRSQPSWDKWSRSAITSDPSAIKRLFFLFRSFHEKSLTILHGASTDYINSSKTLEDKARFAKKYGAVLSGYTLNTILRAIIMTGIARKVKEPFDYLKDLITAPFRMLPILGHILDGSIRSFANALVKYKSEYRGEAIESLPVEVINQISRAPKNFTRAAGYYIGGEPEKGNESLKNAVGQLYMGIGLAMGIPVYELNRIYKGWIKSEKKPRKKFAR